MRQRPFLRHDVAATARVCTRSLFGTLAVLALSAGLASITACRERDDVAFAHLGLGLTHPASLELPMPVSIELPLARAAGAVVAHGIERDQAAPVPDSQAMPARIAPPHARTSIPATALVPYHVELRARHLPALRLEIHIDRSPPQPRTALALARSLRHGASLEIADVRAEQIAGRRWQRTRFSHASGAGPMIGIEYAAVSGAHVYCVTAYGPPDAARALAERVAPTLRLDGDDEQPLWPPAAPSPGTPDAVARAADAVVAVVAADIDLDDAAGAPAIRPVATGSGIAIDAEGHVLTSAHTLHDEQRDALHDLFLVGLERAGVLVFVCAGRPDQAAVDRALDLALIHCELDPGGGPFTPSGWPALATAATPLPAPGARIWVLGRAETDDGALHPRPGHVIDASRPEPDPAGAGLVAIDVPVAAGMSGGAVVDAHGALLGVIHGFRERFQADHAGVRRTGSIGLMRPAAHAQALLEAR